MSLRIFTSWGTCKKDNGHIDNDEYWHKYHDRGLDLSKKCNRTTDKEEKSVASFFWKFQSTYLASICI